jgi:hypothetical protein
MPVDIVTKKRRAIFLIISKGFRIEDESLENY